MNRETATSVRRSIIAVLAVLILHGRAEAQQDVPLATFLSNFVTSSARLESSLTAVDHSQHFFLDTALSEVPRALNEAFGVQLTMFPLTTDWPGVHYGSSGLSAEPSQRLAVFSSSYAERGATSGRGRFSFGFSQQTAQFKWIDGLDVRKGITLYFQHNDAANPGRLGDLQPDFERDILQQTISVRLDRTVFNFVASYGVSDRLDLGIVVPVAKVSFDGRITSHVVRTATASNPEIHSFDRLELDHKTTYATRNVHGLGDLAVRAKLQAAGDETGGLALGVGARLPTGKSEEFLGAGVFGTQLSAMLSSQLGAVGPHLNATYVRGFGNVKTDFGTGTTVEPPQELLLVGGVDMAFHPRWGVSGDLILRHLQGTTRFQTEDTIFPSRGAGPLPTAAYVARDNVVVTGRDLSLNQAYVVVSTKLLVGHQLLFHGDVALPVLKNGFAARPSAIAGFGFGF